MPEDKMNGPEPADAVAQFSPREFLRQRKPQASSDSETVDSPAITRPFLEYFFDTLTSRSEEIDFENFARKLAQRVICPNLQPHTGPTGGGDSKVDTESFAVSEDLALTWYYGYGAHNERWAFAFSAKEDWRGKVQSDVKKIAETKRGYTKAIFISSRFIKDRDRSKVEDDLTKKHKVQVQIHDRNWILDRIFEGSRHFDLLVSEFGLQEALSPTLRKGPRDQDREEELAEIEVRIAAAAQENAFSPAVVDDCLEAVRVARALERPRHEVDGLLMRAARMAENAGTSHQRMMAAYETAWTAFWFYDDSTPLATVYSVVETYALETGNISDLELLSNLWLLLRTSVGRDWLDAEALSFTQRAQTLRTALEAASADDARPSGALYARTMLLELELISAEREKAGALLLALRDALLSSEGLLGYPLMRVIDRMLQVGEHFEELDEYDELYATMATLRGRREGETAEALMYLERGQRLIQQKRPFGAVRAFGRVLSQLYTDETRDEVSVALYLCGFAFEQIGLLWAARSATLHAANIASADFYVRRELTWLQAAGYNRMKWLELKLGRVPAIMAWHELDITVRGALEQQNRTTPSVDSDHLFDLLVGVLLLKTRDEQFPQITQLPDALDRVHLYLAAGTVRYLLGHDSELPDTLVGDDVDRFFEKLAVQPAAGQLPSRVLFDVREGVDGRVLGCRIRITTDKERSSVHLAESVAAMIESFLATADYRDVIAAGPLLSMTIRHQPQLSQLVDWVVRDEYGNPYVDIATNIPATGISASIQVELKKRLSDLLMEVVARAFHFRDLEQTFTTLLRDEEALGRAIDFGVVFVVTTNILGESPKDTVGDWIEAEDRSYTVNCASVPHAASTAAAARPPARRDKSEDEAGLPSHDNLENVSLIRLGLWQRAGWFGTAFFMSPDMSEPPTLALLFRDPSAAEEIFQGWVNELGTTDPGNRLRISIVRGVTRENALAYSVLVGTNPGSDDDPDKHFATFTRVCRMDAQSDAHLGSFLMRYERLGSYFLVAAILEDSVGSRVGTAFLHKTALQVRNAWEIGLNDPDAAAITPDDDVIIPDGVEDAPVVELQAWLRSLST